jgi:hypothetical protein
MLLDQGDIAPKSEERRGNARPALDDLNVLFLPKNSRTDYFTSLLRAARQEHGWRIHVPCVPNAEKIWSGIIGREGAVYTVPDFSAATAWERDAATVEDLDRFIAACERATGISAGRIILAGERDLGRGFSQPTYYWFHNRIAQRALADTSESFRILRRMFAFASNTLRAAQPDLVLAGEWADPLCFCFNLAARQMGIACAVNRLSKLWSGRCYWSADPLMYSEATRAHAAELRARNASVSARAREQISAFRSKPKTLGYVQANWRASDRSESWRALHVQLARLAWVSLRHRLQRRQGQLPKPALKVAWDYYRRGYLKWRQSNLFCRLDDKTLRGMRYLFIALHKDPEQALNYQAPFWVSQYNTVSLLISALPMGYRLLVREHRNNAGRRPTRYYRDLSRLPGVVLIDGFDDQFKYSANADLIVTDNGSTGWEGLLLGRPVITLTDTFYDSAGLAHRVNNPEELAATVVEILNRPPAAAAPLHDQALGWTLDAEWDSSTEAGEAGHSGALDLLADLYAGQSAHAMQRGSSTV